MRVPDISVSRYHASIEFKDGHFVVSDNDSKFGTLIMLKEPIIIDPKVYSGNDSDLDLKLEVGRTLIGI